MGRDRVLACGVRLLGGLGFFRVGGESHSREHHTYGLTTMVREHVWCTRGEIAFWGGRAWHEAHGADL